MGAVTISYPEGAVREECLIEGELKGFGQLHPRTQGVETLGKSIMINVLTLGKAPFPNEAKRRGVIWTFL